MEAFIDHHIKLVQKEKQVDVEDTAKLLSSYAPAQLQKRGVALIGLKVTGMRTGLGGKCLIDVELANPSKIPPIFPPHKISTGDIVGIDEYKKDKPAKKSARWSGVILRVTDTRITVALSQDMDDELPPEVQERCQIVKLANNVTYERMIKALERVKNCANSDGLMQVLFGSRPPSPVQPVEDLQFFDDTLNTSQQEAVRFALGAPEIALVHGPPDNLVERLARHRMNIVRVGHPARILPTVLEHSLDIITRTCDSGQIVADVRREMDETLGKISKSKNRSERRALYGLMKDLRKDYRARERKVVEEVMNGAQVLISTLNGCGSKNMFNKEFDVVIIDEATQALEAECWIALLKGKKAILAGDHLQLPPTIKSQVMSTSKPPAKKGVLSTDGDLSITLFDRLLSMYGNNIKRMLAVQYRMHQKIMEFSSKELYENKLTADESVAAHLLCGLPEVTATEDTEVPLVMIDTSDTGLSYEIADEENEGDAQSKANEREIELAVHHVEALIEGGLQQEHIGVITPYAAQVTGLIRVMRERWPHIEIGTVDGFQGREKEAILLSLVRSNDEGDVGFLAEKRRLNGGKQASSSRPDGGFLKRWINWLNEESDLRFSEFVVPA
ncbi:hypothetical protein EC973_003683 [Apophysomyces ossiformis]|uniref:DNA helicase n=1 Tax=Apophysomyces ossiformis TaxID=679940 RepID=A0A8H7BGZ2_9FUNG|nr:hypothetical protein EC973_003683 [Apophysomyces ossiformis]